MAEHQQRPSPGSFHVGGNLSAHGRSTVAGGNIHQGDNIGRDKNIKNVKNFRLRLGIGLIVLVLAGGGGYAVIRQVTADPTDVVYEEGLDGAADTVAAIKQAEVDGDAADWCFLASAQAGDTCRSMMSATFGGNAELRAELPEVEFGAASGSGSSAQLDVSFRGTKMGIVPLQWDGERWALQAGVYYATINNGGLAMSAVVTYHGCGALGGMVTECKR